MLWELFVTFLLIGALSFGGGYSMIPVMEREVVASHAWMTLPEFADAVAVAGMSPGPMATNTAIYIGYHAAGLPGAIVSALGTVLPALLLVVVVSVFLFKLHRFPWVQSGFYGLRPVVAGLIFYAAFTFAWGNGLLPTDPGAFDAAFAGLALIFGASLFALFRYQAHPLAIIGLAGLAGMAFYG